MSGALTQTLENNDKAESLKKRIMDQKDGLFVLPSVAMDAMTFSHDPACSLSDFACLVEKDTKLTTSILSMSNSVAFTSARPVSSIHQAIVRLGIRQVRNIIMSVCAQGLIQSVTLKQEWIRDLLWRHSFTTAVTCMYMNRAFALGFQGEEFTAGLLHDFGRTALAVVAEDEFGDADPLDFIEADGFMELERRLFGTDHCEFGSWFARELGIPESLTEAIQWHHDPENELIKDRKLVMLVAAADHVANHIQRHDEAAGYAPEENAAIKTLSDEFGSGIADNFLTIADQLIGEVRELSTQNSSCINGG